MKKEETLKCLEQHARDIVKIAEDYGLNSDQFYARLLAILAIVRMEGMRMFTDKIAEEEGG